MKHALHSEDAPITPGDRLGHGVYGDITADDLKALSGEQLKALNPPFRMGRERLYVVGTIEYTQPPEIYHWTKFCLLYAPHEIWPLIFCKGGNGTDEDEPEKAKAGQHPN